MTNTQTAAPLVAPTGPRIFVVCLAAYNNGRLPGAWIETDRGKDHIWDGARAMLTVSPEPAAEEWAIHDHEGFEGASRSEYASFESDGALAELIIEHGAIGAKLYEYFGNDIAEARGAFNRYAGAFASAADFANQVHEDIGTKFPACLTHDIDWKMLARDMSLGGEILSFQTEMNRIYVFWAV
jgi:antirestriction protein